MCGQNMFLDFKKIHPLCAFNNYKYDKTSKTQQLILLFSATSFDLKGHDQFEHKIKRFNIDSLYDI